MPERRPGRVKNRVRLSEFVTDIGVLLQTSERVGTPECAILLHLLAGFCTCTFRKSDKMLALSSLFFDISSLCFFSHFFSSHARKNRICEGKKTYAMLFPTRKLPFSGFELCVPSKFHQIPKLFPLKF